MDYSNNYRGVNYANPSGGTNIRPIIGYQPPVQAQVYNYGRNNQLLNSYTGSYSAPIYGDLPGSPARYGSDGSSGITPLQAHGLSSIPGSDYVPTGSSQGSYLSGSDRLPMNPSSSGGTFAPSGGSSQGSFAPSFGAGGTTSSSGSSHGYNYPFALPVPNLSFADPATLSRFGASLSNLIWSPTAGGYLTQAEASNANSWYNKFGAGGGGDPAANSAAAAFYKYIGSLPTRPVGTPALNMFYQQFGGAPAAGQSYNSILGGSYQGPYGFGERNPNYNQYGSYKGVGGGGGPMTGTAW